MAVIIDTEPDPDKPLYSIWDGSNVRLKTDLSAHQIEAVNKLTTLSNIFGSRLLRFHVEDFMTLNISKDRKSRAEYIEGMKNKKTEILDKMKNFSLTGK